MSSKFMLIEGQAAHSFDSLTELQTYVNKLVSNEEANLQKQLDVEDYYDGYEYDPSCPPSWSYDDYIDESCPPSW